PAGALRAAARIASTKQVDAVAQEALGLTVGPFTAMNLTGGNPITNVGLDNYHSRIHSWYRSPETLAKAVDSGARWDTPSRGEKVEVPESVGKTVGEALQGAFFGICSEIVESGISNVDDMDMAVEIALDMRAPFRFMNRIGTAEALRLVREYAGSNPGFPVPSVLEERGEKNEPFAIRHIGRRDENGVAVLTIRRPRVLNALNQDIFDELREHFAAIRSDQKVEAVVLTGFGVKAFVSGADVKFLARIESPEQGEATARDSQDALNRIEDLGKPVVCAYNGLAFGGGNELAMACHARIALSNLRVLAAQPEVNLGIIPGAGGTQRLPRLIGFEKAAELLRSGRPISPQEALECGLVSELVDGTIVDLRNRAVALARDLAEGRASVTPIPSEAMSPVPDSLPALELGHLSRAVDAIVVAAILEGARLPLKEGIALEARKFGEVCGLKDMRIGVENFIANGPRAKAAFVHS
ncbi:MAG: enoyl-CoA hydratase/isomerase family protein, partial [Planctomycetota bacterium]